MRRRRSGTAAVDQALHAIRRAYQAAAQQIEGIEDPQEAFHRADELAEGIRQLYDEQATRLRAAQVGRIWAAEETDLETLARRISRPGKSRSKQRAHQLLQAAFKHQQEERSP